MLHVLLILMKTQIQDHYWFQQTQVQVMFHVNLLGLQLLLIQQQMFILWHLGEHEGKELEDSQWGRRKSSMAFR